MNKSGLPYDVYIFDLDGTLTDSEPGIVNSVQYALEQLNRPVADRSILRPFVGPPLMYSFQTVLGMTEDEAYQTIRLFQKRYRAKGYLENSVFRGIPGMLKSLKEKGARLAVATAKPDEFARKVLRAFNLERFFDIVSAPMDEDESRFKERLVKKVLNAEKGRACMVGDRNMDIVAAKSCSIDAIGVLFGYGSREELQSAGADVLCATVSDLSEKLGADPVRKGAFITLEGCDGCGKSTQSQKLVKWLEECGYEVVRTREPGGCPISEKIREIVLSVDSKGMSDMCEAYLFAAARAQHVREIIKPALDEGKIVVSDRFVHSSIAYQGAGRGLGLDTVRGINAYAVGDCAPVAAIWLDVDVKEALTRRMADKSPDRIEKENVGFMERAREGYRLLTQTDERLIRVDASGTPDEVFERVRAVASKVV